MEAPSMPVMSTHAWQSRSPSGRLGSRAMAWASSAETFGTPASLLTCPSEVTRGPRGGRGPGPPRQKAAGLLATLRRPRRSVRPVDVLVRSGAAGLPDDLGCEVTHLHVAV